jgi:hypothetical protein
MDEHNFLGKNQKLAQKWTSPHKVLRLKGDSNLEIQLRHNNRKTVVHANRLKPYFVASKNAAVFPDNLSTEPMPTPSQQPPDNQRFPEPEDYSDTVWPLLPFNIEAKGTLPSPPVKARPRTRTSSSTPVEIYDPPSSHTQSKSTTVKVMAPEKPALFFPQVTSEPLHLFQNREGLENETCNDREEISINFVDNDNTWTLVKRKKRTKVDDLKWNKQQRENFK